MATVFRRSGARSKTPESAWRSEAIALMKIRYGKRLYHHRNQQGLGSKAGVPDDFFLIRTSADGVEPVTCVFVAIEFKEPDYKDRGKPIPRDIKSQFASHPEFLSQWDRRTEQDKQIEAIRDCGGRAAKVRNWEELERLLEGIIPEQPALFSRKVQR